ncbi:MAG: AmmeMemoRadiSam system protein B [Melioribacteraceae bacterium]
MVSRPSRKQIAFGFIAIAIVGAISLFAYNKRDLPAQNTTYLASGSALDLAVLDGIVNADKDYPKKDDGIVKAVVVPHHLVASKSIALGIKAMASSSLNRVVIISPDHFFRCQKMLCTTDGNFESFFGKTTISKQDVEELKKSEDVVESSELFSNEHGIYTIVPFIKHYIPNAKIVPIVVSQNGTGSEQDRTKILKLLKTLLSKNGVGLVISSDFSHYLPLKESDQIDVKTQNSFCSGNSQEILTLKNPEQSDCPLCLWILEQTAKELGFWNPNLVIHTNSANLMNDTSVKETTSHFTFTLLATDTTNSCPIMKND